MMNTDKLTKWFGRGKLNKSLLIMFLAVAMAFQFLPPVIPQAHASTCSTPTQNEIEGCVSNWDTGLPVVGQSVYVVACIGSDTHYTTTDSNGHFSFQPHLGNGNPCIVANSKYVVSVNGITPYTAQGGCSTVPNCNQLGYSADDPAWSQWVGDFWTDGSGYRSQSIQLQAAGQMIVPAASMYSNTQFAALDFSTSQTHTVSTAVSVSIGGASSIQAGFASTFSVTSTAGLHDDPGNQNYLGQNSYVIGYYCAGSQAINIHWSCTQGLQTAGVTVPVPGYSPSSYAKPEYLNPTSLSGSYLDCREMVAAGSHPFIAFTWSSGSSNLGGISSSISLFGYGLTFTFSATVSSSTSDTSTVTFQPTNGQSLTFRISPAGGTCDHPTFGAELHVWDITQGFSISANPSSVNLGSGQAQSTINLGSVPFLFNLGSSSGTVSLTASQPSGITTSLSSSSVTFSSGGTVSSTLTITVPQCTAPGNYPVTVTGSSGDFSLSTTVQVSVAGNCFSMSSNPVFLYLPYAGWSSSSITITGVGSFSGTVTVSSAGWVDSGHDLYAELCTSTACGTSFNVGVSQGGSASLTLIVQAYSWTSAPDWYTITVIGTTGGQSQSTTVYAHTTPCCGP